MLFDLKVAAILVLLIAKGIGIYRGSCRKDSLFKRISNDSKLEAAVVSSKKLSFLALCAQMCLRSSVCKSFNYNAVTELCETLSQNLQEVGSNKIISANGWKHYQPSTFEDSPRCRPTDGVEPCTAMQACDEVCANPVGFKCRNLANIALGRSATQSSTCFGGAAARAVDGHTAASWEYSSCTHTCGGGWWRVDFGGTARVHAVKITNRGDCCGSRLGNFNIRIGESSDGNGGSNAACAINQGISQGATVTYKCRPRLLGRYLYVQQNLVDELTVCEVQVFGELI